MWTEKLKFNQKRPEYGTMPSSFGDTLKETLKGGCLQINANDLPIKIKSLRTQVADVARKLKVSSHVLQDRNTNMISVWLEKPNARGNRTYRKTSDKTAAA